MKSAVEKSGDLELAGVDDQLTVLISVPSRPLSHLADEGGERQRLAQQAGNLKTQRAALTLMLLVAN